MFLKIWERKVRHKIADPQDAGVEYTGKENAR